MSQEWARFIYGRTQHKDYRFIDKPETLLSVEEFNVKAITNEYRYSSTAADKKMTERVNQGAAIH